MAMLGTVAGLASAGLGAYGAMQQGAASQAAGNYQYAANVAQGKTDVAAAQREMIKKQQEGDLVGSQQIAQAAASGAGVKNPTIASIYGQTAGQADYAGRGALYTGQQRQNALLAEGKLAKWQGDTAKAVAPLNAAAAGIKGLSGINWNSAGNSFSSLFG